jgi:glyoxylase-like metal-dependent hydrolase (beta-lactamase superfamily II)
MTQTNCYIVGAEPAGPGVVIDPGGEGARIVAQVEEAGLAVEYVLLTHAHFDHIGAVPDVLRATCAQLALHAGDRSLLESGGGGARWGLNLPPLPAPDLALEDGQVLEVGELRFRVLATPGHTGGGVSFYVAAEGAVFVGDALFESGVGRTDLPGGDTATLMRSIKRVLFALPEETVVYPGHGPTTTIGREKRANPWVR